MGKMKMKSSAGSSLVLAIALTMHFLVNLTGATLFGVCYGMMGDNLAAPADVVAYYKQHKIPLMRLFQPAPQVMEALRGSGIAVTIGTLNADIPQLASSQDAANQWVATNVVPYVGDITIGYVTVGNEVIPGEFAAQVLPAMQNLQTALTNVNIVNVRATTAVSQAVLGSSFPPSAGAFTEDANAVLPGILKFLSNHGSALLVNVYPYFAYASDPVNVRLDYAQFTAPGPVVTDGKLNYQNLFDAILDAFFSAMERAGAPDVNLFVSETGWPSAGNGNFTTPELAATYNKNFLAHINTIGTPKRPFAAIEGLIFALFNENLKPAGVEQNFGLLYPDLTPVYDIGL